MTRADEAFQAWAKYLRDCYAMPNSKEAFVRGYVAGYEAARREPEAIQS